MSELYKAIAGSPITYLAGDISAGQTTIAVADDTALPDAPNICTIGYGEHIETIRYGAKSNGVLQDVTRGIEGTPRAWQSGTEVARFYTAYDHNAIIQTIMNIYSEGTGWIRFDNGWQICEGVLNFGNLSSDTFESMEFEYPKKFISAPNIFLTTRHTTVTLNTIRNYQTTINGAAAADKVSVSLAHLGFSVHTSTVRVHVLAIGKWK